VRAYRRYLGKREVFPEGLDTGRIWGAWNEDLLPVDWKTVRISCEAAYKIRRIYRRLARSRPPEPYAASLCLSGTKTWSNCWIS
jgi:hypothetical protein